MLHLRIVDSPITPQLSSTTKAATETRHYCDMSGRITQYRENWGRHRQRRRSEDVNSHNEPPSPIWPLVAEASEEGYTRKAGAPFHDYIFRLLTRQGPAARGGARDYKVNGVMTRGIAFVVYPAVYRTSGVMTFIINQDGRAFKRTLARTRPKWRRLSRNTTPTRPGRPPSKVQQPGVRCECRREVGIAGGHRLSGSYSSHTALVPIVIASLGYRFCGVPRPA